MIDVVQDVFIVLLIMAAGVNLSRRDELKERIEELER